jgi:hypothetical protein
MSMSGMIIQNLRIDIVPKHKSNNIVGNSATADINVHLHIIIRGRVICHLKANVILDNVERFS